MIGYDDTGLHLHELSIQYVKKDLKKYEYVRICHFYKKFVKK